MLETFFSHINRSRIVSKHRGRQVEAVQSYLEDFDEEPSFRKRIFNFTSDHIWYYCLLGMGLYNITSALLICVTTMVNPNYVFPRKDIYYLVDICWTVDIVLRIASTRVKNLRTALTSAPKRHFVSYIIEILGVLPIEFIAWKSQFTHNMLQLNRILKMSYIIYTFLYINRQVNSNLMDKIYQLIFFNVVVIMVSTFILAVLTCTDNPDMCTNEEGTLRFLLVATDLVTRYGFGLLGFASAEAKFWLSLISTFFYMSITAAYLAKIALLFLMNAVHKSDFNYKMNAVKSFFVKQGMPQKFIDNVDVFYDMLWSHCDGYEGYMAETRRPYGSAEFRNFIPSAMNMEVQTDIFWATFSHSTLFKHLPLPFLKELAIVMKQQVYIPKQYIFHRDELKDKMVYVFTGTIQLISEEDGATPVFSLEDGTCLGETSLLIPYKSTFKVQCLNICTMQVLERADFLKVSKKYPSVYKKLMQKVKRRYTNAFYLHYIKKLVNKDANSRYMTTMWINYTLHKLMGAKNSLNARKHVVQNVYLQHMIDKNTFKNSIHSARYLSLLAITERTQANSDTLFIKSTFPYILKGDTGLILFWNLFIALIALLCSFKFPIMCLISRGKDVSFYCWIYFITIVWWIDIIVQMRTAVNLRHRVVTNPLGIIRHRLTDIEFLLDIICCIPVETCTAVFVDEKSEDIVYLNRMFKIFRVFKLLNQWNKRYDSTPTFVLMILVSVILFYASIIIACIYYYIACFNNCGLLELPKLVFFTSQILTGTNLWVTAYSETENYSSFNILIYIASTIAFCVYYGLMFSAYAFGMLHQLEERHSFEKLINVIRKIHPPYEIRITNHVNGQRKFSSGINLLQPDYIFESLPKPLLACFFNFQYSSWITDIPVFKDIPHHIVIDILQNTASVKHIQRETVIYYVGDLEDELMILAKGVCESICGNDYEHTLINYNAALNDMEVFLGIPCRNTMITRSNCDIIVINFIQMKRVLLKYSDCTSVKCFPSMRALRTRILNEPSYQTRHENINVNKEKERWIIYHKYDPNYRSVYKKNNMSVFKYLLFSVTFPPNGIFCLTWEIIRCICAIASAFLFLTTTFSMLPYPSSVAFLLTTLDIFAVLDLYVRMHVCFYDKEGILISHPLLTAEKYIKSGFLVDLFGALPVYLIIPTNDYIYLNANKFLQLHRYYRFFKVMRSTIVTSIPWYFKILHIPFYLILVNFGSSLLVALNCEIKLIEDNQLLHRCDKTSIFEINHITEAVTPIKAHLYAFYAISSSITRIAMQGFVVEGNGSMLILGAFSIIGFYCSILSNAFIFTAGNLKFLMDFEIKRLLKFIGRGSLNARITRYVNAFLERYIFMRQYNVHEVIVVLPKSLRRDILWKRYGRILKENFISKCNDTVPFLRNLLISTRYEVIEKDGYIITINDLVKDTIILFSGYVELVAANGKVILTLQPGSLFGNLCDMKYNRMIHTFIASTTVEVLYVNTHDFHRIIMNYKECLNDFKLLRAIHGTHIPGRGKVDTRIAHIARKQQMVSRTKRELKIYWFNLIFIFFGCYFCQMIFLYQIAVSQFKFELLNGFTDLCFLALLIYEFTMYLRTKQSDTITYYKFILTYLKNKFVLMDIAALIPIELTILLYNFDKNLNHYYAFIILRSHVFLRLIYLHRNIHKYDFKFKYRATISYALKPIIMVSFFIMVITAIFMGLAGIFKMNMNVQINRQLLVNKNDRYRFRQFAQWFYVISAMLTHSAQVKYYPVSWVCVTFLILIMMAMKILLSMFNVYVFSLIFASSRSKWNYKNKFRHLMGYLYRYETSQSLVDRVLYYATVSWNTRKGLRYPTLMSLLPNYLRETIIFYSYGYTIEMHPIFAKCHKDFKRQLVTHLKFEYYYYGDYIQYKGIVDHTMYWVHSGEVVGLPELSSLRDDIATTYITGDRFGVSQGIFDNHPHSLSYRANSQTCIISLVKSKWEYLTYYFPNSKRIIYEEVGNIHDDLYESASGRTGEDFFDESSDTDADDNDFNCL